MSDALVRLNRAPEAEARALLVRCCGSSRWVDAMVKARPFKDEAALLAKADAAWGQTGPDDWREAITHHPRIGDVSRLRERFASTASWSAQEQGGMDSAAEDVIQGLAEGNRAYEERFGFGFLVCATGKSAAQMLELLRARLPNTREAELQVAAGEQAKITRLRLHKLLGE